MATRKKTPIDSSKSRGGARTMEELLAKSGYVTHGLSRGQEVEGTVLAAGSKNLVLDIGAKSEALVTEREFEAAKAYIKTLAAGDKVKAVVLVPEAEAGQSLLSLRAAAEKYIWDSLEEKLQTGEEVEVEVEGATRGGLTAGVYGISGFIPSSHLGGELAENPAAAVGRTLKVKVIECDRPKGRLVLSERAVSEAGLLEDQRLALESVEVGEKFRGRITGLADFGVFVQVEKGGVALEGLVHLSQLAWQKATNPAELFGEGEDVEVVVIGKEGGKLALSIKQTQADPWQQAAEKYKPDTKLAGRVTKVAGVGAFVELEDGIEGLIRASKIPTDQALKEGEEVEVFVEEVDPKNRRLSLGLALKKAPVGYK